jgi:hypothetical protein
VEAVVAMAEEIRAEEANEGPAPPEHEDDIYDGQWVRKKNLKDLADILDGMLNWRGAAKNPLYRKSIYTAPSERFDPSKTPNDFQGAQPWTIKIDDDTHALTICDPADKSKVCIATMKNDALVWDDGDAWVRAPTEAAPQDFVTVHKYPAKVTADADVTTKMLTRLKVGTQVKVVEIQGRRARIISPVNGWVSTRQEQADRNGDMIIERAWMPASPR